MISVDVMGCVLGCNSWLVIAKSPPEQLPWSWSMFTETSSQRNYITTMTRCSLGSSLGAHPRIGTTTRLPCQPWTPLSLLCQCSYSCSQLRTWRLKKFLRYDILTFTQSWSIGSVFQHLVDRNEHSTHENHTVLGVVEKVIYLQG